MTKKTKKASTPKSVETLRHEEASRKNIPTAEYQSVMHLEDQNPIRVAYQRRNRDLDPQLVWRGKDRQDASDLIVQAPPLYIQEKIHPKVLVDDLRQRTQAQQPDAAQTSLFADFNGLPSENAKTEFYQHDANWTNRMILGDSLQVMASLAEREGLRGKVQCIYLDPPYGIKFNSNFQWSTTSRDVKDGKADHITREPEQVKAFRDTWRDGIHSYLTYLRDRLVVARDLLTDSGSIFVQIGDENVHRVRALMDEVFDDDNFVSQISYTTTGGLASDTLSRAGDYLIWYAKKKEEIKYRDIVQPKKSPEENFKSKYDQFETKDLVRKTLAQALEELSDSELQNGQIFRVDNIISQGSSDNTIQEFTFQGQIFNCGKNNHWKTNSEVGMPRVGKSNRIAISSNGKLGYIRYFDDYPITRLSNLWSDIGGSVQSRSDPKVYVVQTGTSLIERCMLMTTDPGDLILDPTCGSGSTAYVAEQWGRRWITIDTSRVALALARARIMGARYPYYLLADSRDGQRKEAEITRIAPQETPTAGNIRQGFVYERVPHIMLKDIANNAEIDVIWEQFQEKLEPLRKQLNKLLKTTWEEWEIPREAKDDWSDEAKAAHEQWWKLRIQRQKEIDASIAAKAEQEFLYDKPYEDKKKVRVAGPFTVESLSPHRTLGVDENDELLDSLAEDKAGYGKEQSFAEMILDNLKTAGVQQAHKENRINFSSLTPWPGDYVCALGQYTEGTDGNATEKRAAIFVGPEFGTVPRPDLVSAAREAGDAGFDVLIACAFNYDAHSSEFEKLGRIPVLKARMNADLHMAGDLKNTGKGNLFVIFGEPDIDVISEEWLVDSLGNKVAPYEFFAFLSGIDSLAKINGLSSSDLRDYTVLSGRGEIWSRLTDAAGGGLDTSQHRGGTSQTFNQTVSAISRHCQGFAGGVGDPAEFVASLGFSDYPAFRSFIEGLRGDQQNAQRIDQIAQSTSVNLIHTPLATRHYLQVKINGVDVFHPNSGKVQSDGVDGIACWFLDTDYNEESFFVRHAYFLGANDPYKALKTTLKAEINQEAWDTLHSDTSRPFNKPASGRIAVKVINHLGDEVMKVYRVQSGN